MVEALQSASYYLTVHCLKEFSGIVNAVLIINNHPRYNHRHWFEKL